jgi:O-antigen/teichoic acid export membrane protein
MNRAAQPAVIWGETDQTRTVAKNVSTRYGTLGIELVLGLLMLPFNTHYLGPSEYGLWVLAASIVAYFPVLDLGYGIAMERFVAHYRARRDAGAINEIASTLVTVFAGIGAVAFVVIALIAANMGGWFNLDPGQARTGRIVMLFVGLQFAGGLPFAIFGAIVNGFQRTYLNAAVSTAVSLTVAAVNVVVVLMGGTLVELVGWMTLARILGYVAYRLNAYRVFPLLHVRPGLFRKERLREVTGFSVYMMMQDASNKVNYATDPIVIAAALAPGAVAVWTVAQRLADVAIQLTNQLNYVLLPIVVDYDSAQRDDRLQDLLVQGTRFSLATTLPVAGTMALLAYPVVVGWTGPGFAAAAPVLQILALVVVVRVGSATASTMLQGAGRHRLVAGSNIAAASTNVALSFLLVYPFGLPGVAIATLIPISLRAAVILIPAACRRVGIPLHGFFRAAIWPALWPTAVALALVLWLRPHVDSLLEAVLVGAAGAAVYAPLFLGVAIGARDRSRYLGKLRSLTRRPVEQAA